jgi:hypothetical protein
MELPFIEIPGPEPEGVNERGPETRVTGQFVDSSGVYYVGDKQAPGDLLVPPRPSSAHKWVSGAWTLDTRADALANISALEAEQNARLTPRAMREFILIVTNALGASGTPAFAALASLDTRIRAERAKL